MSTTATKEKKMVDSGVKFKFKKTVKDDRIVFEDDTAYEETFKDSLETRKKIIREDATFNKAVIHEGNKKIIEELAKNNNARVEIKVQNSPFKTDNIKLISEEDKDGARETYYTTHHGHYPSSKMMEEKHKEIMKSLAKKK